MDILNLTHIRIQPKILKFLRPTCVPPLRPTWVPPCVPLMRPSVPGPTFPVCQSLPLFYKDLFVSYFTCKNMKYRIYGFSLSQSDCLYFFKLTIRFVIYDIFKDQNMGFCISLNLQYLNSPLYNFCWKFWCPWWKLVLFIIFFKFPPCLKCPFFRAPLF